MLYINLPVLYYHGNGIYMSQKGLRQAGGVFRCLSGLSSFSKQAMGSTGIPCSSWVMTLCILSVSVCTLCIGYATTYPYGVPDI